MSDPKVKAAITAHRAAWGLAPITPENWEHVLAHAERRHLTAHDFDKARPSPGEAPAARKTPQEWTAIGEDMRDRARALELREIMAGGPMPLHLEDCPSCGGTGWITTRGADGYDDAERCPICRATID